MEIQEALDIVRKLANSVYPAAGQAVVADSLYQNPRSVRALHRAVQALEFQQARERRRSLPANAGKPWSNAEEAQICEELRRGANFQEIARTHGRTVGSIVARLIRLGRISVQASRSNAQTKSA